MLVSFLRWTWWLLQLQEKRHGGAFEVLQANLGRHGCFWMRRERVVQSQAEERAVHRVSASIRRCLCRGKLLQEQERRTRERDRQQFLSILPPQILDSQHPASVPCIADHDVNFCEQTP